MTKKKIQLEYIMNVLPSVLFGQLYTPSGLSDWFADDVLVDHDSYTFKWGDSEEKALLIASRANVYVRFRRVDEDEDNTYFEFRINEDELTSDVALIVTDFVDEDDEDGQCELWNTQIDKLKRVLGV